MLVIVLMVALATVVRRGVLQAREVAWIGLALIFFSTSLIAKIVLSQVRGLYPHGSPGIWLGLMALFALPLVLALAFGVYMLYRSLTVKELATAEEGRCTLRLVQGSLAALPGTRIAVPIDALIVPSNTQLRMGGPVAGLVKSFAGAGIERKSRQKAPMTVGQALATEAGRLPVTTLIHAVLFGGTGPLDEATLRKPLDNALKAARKAGARRVALSALGLRSLSAEQVASVTMAVIKAAASGFDEIVVVAPTAGTAAPFRTEFARLTDPSLASRSKANTA